MPLVIFTGETEKASPVQMAVVIAVTAGLGFTVTTTLKGVPAQPIEVGVTEYVTLMAALVVLVSVPEILAALVPAAAPVIPVTTGAAQVYVVPVGIKPSVPFTGETVKPVALQVVVAIAVTAGLGFIVTVTLNGFPTQEPEVGVTEYTTLMGALVVLVRFPEMLAAAVPSAVPVIPETTGAVQE